MTNFEDGPARGQHLMLKRAPRFLRIVVDGSGNWDGLDQPNDAPSRFERIYAYEITGKPGMAFVDFGGKQRPASGAYPIASYRFIAPQPSDQDMRDQSRWEQWCRTKAGVSAQQS